MNSALIKIGADQIMSQNDNNARARACKTRYPIIRDLFLRSHPWHFATNYVQLAAIAPFPANVYEYKFAYQRPVDMLRILETSLTQFDRWEEIAGGLIVCNVGTLTVKGIMRITDVTKWDDNVVEALAYALAKDLTYLVTQSAAQVKQVSDDAKMSLREARSFNAQIGSVKRVAADEWFDSRRY